MKFQYILIALAVAGCAEKNLDRRETEALKFQTITAKSTLEEQSVFAGNLSAAYLAAARDTVDQQDVASALIIVSAASVAVGALGDASNRALANRASVGIGTQTIASRGLTGLAIKSLFNGAKRMNCIASVSRIGIEYLATQNSPTKRAARAATHGALVEVQILLREGLVREVPDYSTLLSDFKDALKIERDGNGLREMSISESANPATLNIYFGLLDNCLGQKAGSLSGADLK